MTGYDERKRKPASRGKTILSLALFSLALAGCAPDRDARPNIIFVFTDDHASHAISAYGSSINQTPNIDRLADEGMLFRNAFVTNSICAPSRAVILTGKHSHLNGIFTNRERFDSAQVTFPKLLQQAGYQTAIVGKWHLKSAPTGFDYWEVLPGQGDYYNPRFRTHGDTVRYTGYVTDVITDRALDWLQNGRDPEKPFMLMYQHKAPHRRWQPGPDHLTLYDDTTIPEPPTLFDDYTGRTSAAKTQDLKLVAPPQLNEQQLEHWNAAYEPKNEAFRQAELTGDELVRWKYQRYIKDYLRTIASVDDNLGRVLDYLDEAGLTENTVVIYSSDQGFYLGDHGWYDKRWMYEESLRMPFVVRWPGVVQPGSENSDLVQNLDFAETFLEMAGVDVPADMQGRSLVPLLQGRTPADWRDAIYYHYWEYPAWHMVRRHYGVRTQRYKLIYYYEIDEWELFDLEHDPDELRSVYDDPEHSEIVADLTARLAQMRTDYSVPEQDPVPYPEERTWR
jgi:arylsulfatase A-like enzyme